MKAILEFNLDNKDEVMAHLRAVKSLDTACVLFELTHNLKDKLENHIDNIEEIQDKQLSSMEILDMIFEEINQLMQIHNVNLNELIE